MWKELNRLENKFIKEYTLQDLYDNIADIYNLYKLDYTIADKQTINKFKRIIEANKDKLNDVSLYKANKLLKRTKMSNRDIVKFLIEIEYNKKSNEINDLGKTFMSTLVQHTYEEEEAKIIAKTGLKRKRHPLYVDYALGLLLLPNFDGYIWGEYIDSTTLYNANETFRHLSMNGLKGLKDVLVRQKKKIIKKKEKPTKEDTYTGFLEDTAVGIVNKTKVQVYKDYGIQKVRFIAVIDERTTITCEELNGSEFKVNGKNTFYKYSPYDEKEVYYSVDGLVLGVNLPPLHYNCRSTTEPIYK